MACLSGVFCAAATGQNDAFDKQLHSCLIQQIQQQAKY
jgi:hypothetical protein